MAEDIEVENADEGYDKDHDLQTDFDIMDESFIFSMDNAVFKVETENMGEYIENWKRQSKQLYIRRIDDVKKAYNKFGPVGLFRLFLSKSFVKEVRGCL